jgi:nitrite reductase/ring-hydroxylating ferredoxin subunit
MAFYALEKLSHLHDGYQKAFRVAGHHLLLIQQEGRSYLIENRCPHMDASLADAVQCDGILRCRAHGIEFGLMDGRARGPLAGTIGSLKFFPIVYDANVLGVDL